jgi:hypothetical protein
MAKVVDTLFFEELLEKSESNFDDEDIKFHFLANLCFSGRAKSRGSR